MPSAQPYILPQSKASALQTALAAAEAVAAQTSASTPSKAKAEARAAQTPKAPSIASTAHPSTTTAIGDGLALYGAFLAYMDNMYQSMDIDQLKEEQQNDITRKTILFNSDIY